MRKLPSIGVAAALLALVAWSRWQRWQLLAVSPFPVGIDGYFYPIQLRALLEDGGLAYPASPLTFWVMAPFAAATDPVTGAKLGAAVYGALIALPVYGVGARLGRSRGAGLIAAALATTSAGSAFLTFEFVKNGVGLTVALTALWLVLVALDRPTKPRLAAALVAIGAAILAHKMAAAIVLVVCAPAVLGSLAAKGVLRGRRLMYVLVIVLGGALATIVAGLIAPARFLAPRDLALLTSALTSDARWDAPALITGRTALTMGHEAILGGLVAIVAGIALSRTVRRRLTRSTHPTLVALREAGELTPKRSSAEIAAGWALVALALVIALPWLDVRDPQGVAFRLRVVAFVPLSLCAAIALRLVYLPIAIAFARASRPAAIREGVLVALAVVIVAAMPRDRVAGRIVPHPAMVSAAQAAAAHLPKGAVAIIPERHIAFMVAWYARVPVRLRPESVPRDRRYRLMPLAFIRMDSPLDHAISAARAQPSLAPPIGLHARHPNGFVLVAEPTWEWVLAQLPAGDRAHYTTWPTI